MRQFFRLLAGALMLAQGGALAQRALPIEEIEATVEPVGAMGPHGFDHQPGHPPAKGNAHKH